MYIYCVYSAVSTSPKQAPNCLKIAETSVGIIVSMVSSGKYALIPLPSLTVALHE